MKTFITFVAGLLALFLVLPIWFYLLYKILVLVEATELMFFLYWVYVPASILVQTFIKLAEKLGD